MSISLNQFADNFLLELMVEAPDIAINLGIELVAGRQLATNTLPDFSDEGMVRRKALMAQWAQHYRHHDIRVVSSQEQITAKVLEYIFREGVYSWFPGETACNIEANPYPVTHLNGPHATVTVMLTRDHNIYNLADAEAYLERLQKYPVALDQATTTLKERRAAGIIAPRSLLSAALSDMQGFVESEVEQNPVYRDFRRKCAAANIEPVKQGRLQAAADSLLNGDIRHAYERLMGELNRHIRAGDMPAGLWARSGGDEYYAWRLRAQTTTDMTPDEVHELGLAETEKVQEEVRSQAAILKISGQTMSEIFEALENSRAHEQKPIKRRDVLAHVDDIVAQLEENVRPLFRIWPHSPLRVEPIAAEFEPSMHSHYVPPSAGGRRPGIFLLNVAHARENFESDLAVLCAHEAFPGHHLQLTVAQELEVLPLFRRAMLFASYLEGWAKYAETIPTRFGLHNDPYQALARLRNELYSTVNMVVDTGIHVKRWPQDKAERFFRHQAGANATLASMVAKRSMAMAGQLCSYKVGMLTMVRLFNEFKAVRGQAFDPRDFHDAVLSLSAVPLKVMTEAVMEQAEHRK